MNKTRIYKAIVAAVFCVLCLAGCKKPAPIEKIDLTGEWHLVTFSAGEAEKMDVDVYIAFDKATDSFSIYQKIGEGHYTLHEGTYLLTNGLLNGTYKDGATFACSYTVSMEDDVLTMTSRDITPEEVCTYKRKAIPSEVKKDALDYGTKAETLIRFL